MPRLDIHKTFMKIAEQIAQLSYAEKLKVGCILVKDQNIVATGYNGMPKGFDNQCENTEILEAKLKEVSMTPGSHVIGLSDVTSKLKTKPEVLHAESNAIAKCSRSTVSSLGCEMYVTHAPCINCAKLIVQSGISKVFYLNDYKRIDGLELLIRANIKLEKIYYEIN